MEIPALSNPVWVNIVLGKVQPAFGFLATKIFLGRVKMSLSFDSSQQNINKLAAELRELFVKNVSIPSLQKDLELILK